MSVTATLLPQHQALIDGSAIAPDIARARGYRSITEAAELRRLGFADYQCRTPGLLVPIWDVAGQNGRHQFRPDDPRRNDAGKPVKYETPAGSRLRLDVPATVRPLLADPTVPLVITEGARKVDCAISHGLCCVGVPGVWGWRGTNERGGKTALPDWESIALNGREVLIAFDSDVMEKESVRQAVERFSAFLASRSARVRFVLLLEGPADEKTGLDDYFARGGTVEGFAALTVEHLPAAEPIAVLGHGAARPKQQDSSIAWPTLDAAAMHGLAGDVVRAIEPHTEGDPVALLANFLVMFGSALGATPHALVGATRHPVNEFAVHVGETARAQKGTAHNEVERIVALADTDWRERVRGGLSSGEGLIYAVRDAFWKPNTKGESVLADPGIDDKRLLAVEPEFSSVLRVAGREGNTLSEQLRRAWDGDNLHSMTRNAPLDATNPHISMLGHITRPELLRELSETYQANGFANRFTFYCVRRSKALPHGGALSDAALAELADRVRHALTAARTIGAVRRDAETDTVWEGVYPALTAERPGMFGAITARAEAHVLRFSTLYALLDRSRDIRRPHLDAALALWQFAEDSARFIFGDATGDPIADQILSALRRNGPMTQTQVSELFGRNQKAGRIEQALTLLLSSGLAHTWQGESEHGGRRPTYWQAIQ